MQKKESFIIYKSFYAPIRHLSDIHLAQLFRAIFEYQINGIEVDQDSEVFMPFQFFKNQFEIDERKYQMVCEKRSAAASKRWDGDASASKSIQKDAKDADNDNVNDKKRKRNNDKEKDNEIVNPFSDSFQAIWEGWIQYKKEEHSFRYKSGKSQQIAINGLHKLSGGDESLALKIIEQSMINGWKGFFALKDQQLSKQSKKNLGVSEAYLESLKNRINGGN